MSETTVTPQPPPKPPAPGATSKAAVATPAPVVKLTPEEQLLAWSAELTSIASKVPTRNVVDSDVHGARIAEIAAGMKEMAEA